MRKIKRVYCKDDCRVVSDLVGDIGMKSYVVRVCFLVVDLL